MKLLESMIVWNPGTDQIAVVRWPDCGRLSTGYRYSTGACEMRLHKMSREAQRALLFIHFNTIVVRDNVPPQAAHRAFLAIDEYRQLISPDMQGADDDDEDAVTI